MKALVSLLDRSESAALGIARATQAAALQAADWGQRRTPAPSRFLAKEWLEWISLNVEDPSRLSARPYDVLQQMLTLHREFVQRLLEIAEEPASPVSPVADSVKDAEIVDLAVKQRQRDLRT